MNVEDMMIRKFMVAVILCMSSVTCLHAQMSNRILEGKVYIARENVKILSKGILVKTPKAFFV